MLEISKIENGLSWKSQDRLFTKEYFENSYEIINEILISIELDAMIICLKSDDTTIDGVGPFNNSQELVDAIFS